MNVEAKVQEAITLNRDALIKYQKYNGEVSIRKISSIEESDEFGANYIYAFCHLRNEWRTFRIDRIIEIKVLETSTPAAIPKPSKSQTVLRQSSYSHTQSYRSSQQSFSRSYSSRSTTSKSEGCYIATAVYGTYDHPQVIVLRMFRDDILLNSQIGRKFVHLYYRYSPRIADKLKNNYLFNIIIRKLLDCFTQIINCRTSRHR